MLARWPVVKGGRVALSRGQVMGLIQPEIYAQWRRKRLGEVTEQVERELIMGLAGPLHGRRVLDVGCGDGTYVIEAASRGAVVTGVDSSQRMLDAARQRARDAGVECRLELADATSLPFSDASFDVVFIVTALCFVEDADKAFREAARVLVPGGRLVVGELNRWSTWAAWRSLRALLGSPIWRHARFRSAQELVRLAQGAGLSVERTAGAVYFPPVGLLAQLMAPFDRPLGTLTTLGAAFVAVMAIKGV